MDQVLGRHGLNVDDQNVERRQPQEDDRKTVAKEVDSLCSSLCLKKKTEEKTRTSHIKCKVADQVAPKAPITMEGSPTMQYCISRKPHNVEAAKVSGQQTKYLLSKPQQVYSSVEIEDQTVPGCTGPFNQWERSVGMTCEALGPSGQSGRDRDYTQERQRF